MSRGLRRGKRVRSSAPPAGAQRLAGATQRLAAAVQGALGTGDEAEEALRRMALLDGMVAAWSDRLNLTSFDTEDERTRRYFVEALAAYPFLPAGGEAMDIGSGGGSPALPLAILALGLRWTLFESRRKKAWFLEEAVRLLGIGNVSVEARRFESGGPGRWSVATCRGVRVGPRMMREVERSLLPGGAFLWFSAEGRLAEAVRSAETSSWASVEGPIPLHPEAPAGGALLVCRRGAGPA